METEDCLIVVDFESTCDTGGRIQPYEMEIIEIGAAKVRLSDGEILSSFQSFVKPIHRPQLTRFCQRLTGIQQQEIDRAQPFAQVLIEFQSWLNHPFWTLASWGDFDRDLLQRELERLSEDPIFTQHLNLKAIAKDTWGLKKTGLKEVLRQQGLTPIGTHHRALDDVKSIAQLVPLLSNLLK